MAVKSVLFDFIGTTVIEKDPSLILTCFLNAFKDHDIDVDVEFLRANRGRDKNELIDLMLQKLKKPLHLRFEILRAFKQHFKNNISNFEENKGLEDVVFFLKARKIKVGVGTGLTRDIFQLLLEHFHWERFGFDYLSTAEEAGRGRPHPDMIIDMMVKLHLNNYQFLKVGDTIADIEEGKNAEVLTAVLLSGTQDANTLRECKPDYVLKTLPDIKQII
jgi:phosphonoacetaldehyde hydrolase